MTFNKKFECDARYKNDAMRAKALIACKHPMQHLCECKVCTELQETTFPKDMSAEIKDMERLAEFRTSLCELRVGEM